MNLGSPQRNDKQKARSGDRKDDDDETTTTKTMTRRDETRRDETTTNWPDEGGLHQDDKN